MDELNAATAKAADGDFDAAEGAVRNWDQGLAFWRVIEAYAAAQGADVDTVNSIFDLANESGVTGNGDTVRTALAPAWDAVGISSDDDIGVLQ